MGNTSTKSANSLEDAIRKYASKYILRANFQDMVNMSNPNYCEELVVLTSDLIDSKLNSSEIHQIASLEKYTPEKPTRAKVKYATKKTMKNIMSKEKKLSYCRGIARYYVKVLNLLSAIVMTVKPKFTFKDNNNRSQTVRVKDRNSVLDKQRISVSFSYDNFCGRRFEALMKGIGNDSHSRKDSEGNIRITNNVCGMNEKRDNLKDEVGIPELEKLYYDLYDPKTKMYNRKSSQMKQAYKKDLKRFYKSFTGKDLTDKDVTKFSHIPLRDYQKEDACAKGNIIEVNGKGTAFDLYANHLKKMMQTTDKFKGELLKILDQLFEEVNDSTYVLRQLPETTIDNMIKTTRSKIVEMYATCEDETSKGLKLFQAVIEAKTGEVNIIRAQSNDGRDEHSHHHSYRTHDDTLKQKYDDFRDYDTSHIDSDDPDSIQKQRTKGRLNEHQYDQNSYLARKKELEQSINRDRKHKYMLSQNDYDEYNQRRIQNLDNSISAKMKGYNTLRNAQYPNHNAQYHNAQYPNHNAQYHNAQYPNNNMRYSQSNVMGNERYTQTTKGEIERKIRQLEETIKYNKEKFRHPENYSEREAISKHIRNLQREIQKLEIDKRIA